MIIYNIIFIIIKEEEEGIPPDRRGGRKHISTYACVCYVRWKGAPVGRREMGCRIIFFNDKSNR